MYGSLGSVVATGTITSPWTPVSAGPTAADTNGSGSDTKNLDVGDISDDEKDLAAADAEGVWSPDIEQSFQEALAIYPPCGRRKIILSDEGKMYGRNELIARYIKLRTGKTRTRKQVSSHIQVLARRKLREIQAKLKVVGPQHHQDHAAKEKALQTMSSMSSAQIVSAAAAMHPAAGGKTHHHVHHMAHHLSAHLATSPISNNHHHPYPPTAVVAQAPPQFWQPGLQPGTSQDVKPFPQGAYPGGKPATAVSAGEAGGLQAPPPPPWEGRSIATHKLRLVEFSAFMEQQRDPDTYHKHLFVHIGGTPTYTDAVLEAVDVRQIYDKFPEKKGGLKELYDKGPQQAFFLVKFWADLNTNIQDEAGAFYGVTSQYESNENMTITCSTKVCSFGKQVVEKVETEYARFENGRFVYRIHRSPMCEYMINFIHKLKHLPEKYMMNSVLENFTILQVVSNRDTQETLLCTAYVFEVSTSEHGAQHHIYRLVKD
ncbi:protein scalloped isoform X2 [Chrysoperla carnea]|uniref:protein scalloped isoform X2 n=1 Tax=Chrysoperla carnea TaxID=189513 RepID=UPI001D0932EC|nr:protein scalloped isoform X2 [Chrysoperla carnea]XP_044728489.1 protein scalloped isoform X2 [Chrysoperla carnea]